METIACWKAGRGLLAWMLGALLAGCSTVGTVLQEQYDMAQNVTIGCKVVEDTFVIPDMDDVKEELVGRLRARLTSAFCGTTGTAANCKDPAQGSLKVRFTEDIRQLVQHARSLEASIDTDVKQIDTSLDNIKTALDAIEQVLDDAKKTLNTANSQNCQSKTACAQVLLNEMNLDMAKLQGQYNSIERELGKVALRLKSIRTAIVDRHPELVEDLDHAVATGREVVQTAYRVLGAFVTKDAATLGKEVLEIKINYAAAEQTLKLIERGLAPADRLLDKGDDKFFLLPTLVITWNSGTIQTAMDDLYAKLVRPATPAEDGKPEQSEGPLHKTDLRWAFAKGSCKRLTDDTVQSSQLMPFIERMFLFNLVPPKPKEEPPAKVVDPEKLAKSVNEMHQAEVSKLKLEGTPYFTQAELFQTCYVTQTSAVAVARVSRDSATVASAQVTGARACGVMATSVAAPRKAKELLFIQKQQVDKAVAAMSALEQPRAGVVQTQEQKQMAVLKDELEARQRALVEAQKTVAASAKPFSLHNVPAASKANTWATARTIITSP